MKKTFSILLLIAFPLSFFSQIDSSKYRDFTSDYVEENFNEKIYLYSLDSCKKLALANNAKISNAKIDIEAAKETKQAAFTKYFPQISATAATFKLHSSLIDADLGSGDISVSFENQRINDILLTLYNLYGAYLPSVDVNMKMIDKGIVAGATAVQPVFMGGRIINGNKLANLGIEAAELQSQMIENEVEIKTEELYWLVISLNEKSKIISSLDCLLDTLYKDVNGAVNAGVLNKNDITKVTIKQSEVKSNKLKLDNGLQLAKMALCQHIGIAYTPNFALSDTILQIENPEIYRVAHDEALKSRIEYNLLDLNVSAELLKKKMVVGETLPQLVVGGGYLFNNLLEKPSNNAVAFATLSIPISGWWEASHNIKKQKLNYQKALNLRNDTDDQLLLQMQQAWNDIQETYTLILFAEENVENAEENLKYLNDNYAAGMINISDVLQAQTLLQQAQTQVSEYKTDYKIKLTKYLQYTQGK